MLNRISKNIFNNYNWNWDILVSWKKIHELHLLIDIIIVLIIILGNYYFKFVQLRPGFFGLVLIYSDNDKPSDSEETIF